MATYGYGGRSRRVSAALGGVLAAAIVAQSFATASGVDGYAGLDRFGRPVDLHYRLGAGTAGAGDTLQQYEYGYDASGKPGSRRLHRLLRPSLTDPQGIGWHVSFRNDDGVPRRHRFNIKERGGDSNPNLRSVTRPPPQCRVRIGVFQRQTRTLDRPSGAVGH